jgi:hypothetical protein
VLHAAQAKAAQIEIPVIIAVVGGGYPLVIGGAVVGGWAPTADPGPPELGGQRAVVHDVQGPCWPRPEHLLGRRERLAACEPAAAAPTGTRDHYDGLV